MRTALALLLTTPLLGQDALDPQVLAAAEAALAATDADAAGAGGQRTEDPHRRGRLRRPARAPELQADVGGLIKIYGSPISPKTISKPAGRRVE